MQRHDNRSALGRAGEDLAAEALARSGVQVWERNWRCREGEIDIIGFDADSAEIVFCEVKCRGGLGFGDPLESITRQKLARMRRLAGAWLASDSPWSRRERGAGIRLDAVGIVWPRGHRPILRHLKGIAA